MIVSEEILESIFYDAGEKRTKDAKEYEAAGRVEITDYDYEDSLNFEIKSIVVGAKIYNSYVSILDGEIEDIKCECDDYHNHYGICKHTLASIVRFSKQTSHFKRKVSKENNIDINKKEFKNFKQIVNTFYNEEVDNIDDVSQIQLRNKHTIKIEPKIIYDKFRTDIRVEFYVGNKKMYKIKDLSEFYINVVEQKFHRYGEKLQFIHHREMFEESSEPLLDFIIKYAEIIKIANSTANSNYRYYGKAINDNSIILGNSGIDELFDILNGKTIEMQKDCNTFDVKFTEEQPDIRFVLKKIEEDKYFIEATIDIYNVSIINGKKYKYILDNSKLSRCTEQFKNANLKLLELFRKNYMTGVLLGKSELSQLFSIIIPKVKDAIDVSHISKREVEKYTPKELIIKVFLDFNKNDHLVADVKFCYGDKEFNPLDEEQKLTIPRNIIEETKAINIFRKTGFMFDSKKMNFIIPNDDKIYEFLSEELELYMNRFQVMVTDRFKAKEIKQPKMGNIGIKVENDLLNIDMSQMGVDISEVKNIMEKYKLKKKYYRLKDGSFINFDDSKELEFIENIITGMDLEYKELEDGKIKIPIHRSLYLDQLLKENDVDKSNNDEKYNKIVNDLNKEKIDEINIPENFDKILRSYQKIGFKWLKTLENYRFGGILADDMGLGKTIQILSVVSDYFQNCKRENKENKTSLVISPSSLTLNWESEAKKFAKDLNSVVVRGTLEERKKIINNLQNYDLIITSYDLLKRDIELYKEKDYTFKYIIADEAQYLKNSTTQNAKSIKELKSETRYALTGTPIENSLAELWSIFDFVMPGYLFSYKKFKSSYETPIVKDEDENALKKLKMLIEPFILRRIKKEVLTELPDKSITVLNNEMSTEQKKIYMSYLSEIKKEVAQIIDENGVEKSHIQILAAITRLRQICCHPSLFIEDYKYESSKLEQCLEIIDEAIEGNHKILLFSGYTSMFGIIEQKLKEKNINYSKLTGATKVDERLKFVNEFNMNKDIKVFLISLKAGGTGLNLTGADMVIHYDPWWNISSENQATDRAYRIGQKNNVQVYKLITKNSIEEKIYELQQKKAGLTDSVLSTKVSFVSKLSKEEIMSLFE